MNPLRRQRRSASRRLPYLASIALFAASLAALPAIPASAQGAKPAGPGFTTLWSRNVEPLIAIALSPQGSFVGMITRSGKLALWSADQGGSIWSQPGLTQHNLVVSDEMGYVLTYDQMNRLDRTVSLYRSAIDEANASGQASPTGRTASRPVRAFKGTLDGAVWTAAMSLDGSYAACGTGTRQVYLLTLGPRPQMTGHPIDGICNDIQFEDNNRYVAIGLWNQSGVETMDMAGRIQWYYPGANNRRYNVSVSPDGRRVLTVSYLNPQWSDPVLSLLDNQGLVRWSYDLGKNAYGPAIALGAGSQISFAFYTETVRRGHEMIPERSRIAIGPSGDPLWSRSGGPFFSLTLVSLSPDGLGVVAYDGNKTLYRLNSDGRDIAHYKLPSSLQYWSASNDHKRLLIYTSDGGLSLLDVR